MQRGLAPRIFEHLFQRVAEEEGETRRVSLKCQYLEIYNEAISDLLAPEAAQLQLREHHRRGCYVEGLSEVSVLNSALLT